MSPKSNSILLVVLLMASSAFGEDVPGADVPGADAAAAVNEFALSLFRSMTNRTENIVLSPFGIHLALSMAREGSGGKTRVEMDEVLSIPADMQLDKSYKALLAAVRSSVTNGQSQFRIGTSLWVQKGFPIEKSFSATLSKSYASAIMQADFKGMPRQAVVDINSWVRKRTGDRIRSAVSSESLSPETVAMLVSTLFFKGAWESPFKYHKTQYGRFMLAGNKPTRTYYMHQTSFLDYGYDQFVTLFSMQYAGGDMEMMFVVPQKPGVYLKEGKKVDAAAVKRWVGLLKSQRVEAYLPKLKFQTQLDLKDMLGDMGMKLAFDPKDADFTKVSENFFLYGAHHVTEIEVEERGTTASSSTAVAAAFGGEPTAPPVFAADRPFLFFIRDRFTGLILFMGSVANPNL
jgi:serpin B